MSREKPNKGNAAPPASSTFPSTAILIVAWAHAHDTRPSSAKHGTGGLGTYIKKGKGISWSTRLSLGFSRLLMTSFAVASIARSERNMEAPEKNKGGRPKGAKTQVTMANYRAMRAVVNQDKSKDKGKLQQAWRKVYQDDQKTFMYKMLAIEEKITRAQEAKNQTVKENVTDQGSEKVLDLINKMLSSGEWKKP